MLLTVSSTQCAAVSTAVGEMSEPPQRYALVSAYCSSTRAIHGDVDSGVGACGAAARARRQREARGAECEAQKSQMSPSCAAECQPGASRRAQAAAAATHRRAAHDALLRLRQERAAARRRCAGCVSAARFRVRRSKSWQARAPGLNASVRRRAPASAAEPEAQAASANARTSPSARILARRAAGAHLPRAPCARVRTARRARAREARPSTGVHAGATQLPVEEGTPI